MATKKSPLKELQLFLSAYEKVHNSEPTVAVIKAKIKELLKEESPQAKQKLSRIYFRESQWSDYITLRDELIKDKNFVRDYAGVDLKAYIEEALAWSEKGNVSTDMGWKLTLKNWMRNAKSNGRLIMKPKSDKKPNTFLNH